MHQIIREILQIYQKKLDCLIRHTEKGDEYLTKMCLFKTLRVAWGFWIPNRSKSLLWTTVPKSVGFQIAPHLGPGNTTHPWRPFSLPPYQGSQGTSSRCEVDLVLLDCHRLGSFPWPTAQHEERKADKGNSIFTYIWLIRKGSVDK